MKKLVLAVVSVLAMGLVISSCSNEEFEKAPAKVVKEETIVPSSAKATGLAIVPSIQNGGQKGLLTFDGVGTMTVTTFDGTVTVETPYEFNGSGRAEVTLAKDTVPVQEFGVELMSYPKDINSKDLTTSTQAGSETTMATWSFSDGQSATGLLNYVYTTVETTNPIPHAEVKDLRFNKVVGVDATSDRFATVTLSFFVDLVGFAAHSTKEGTKEILLSYVQALPEPEVVVPDEPKAPTYSWTLTFENKTKGTKTNLNATFTVTSSDGNNWAYTWKAASCGRYEGIAALYVKDLTVTEKVRNNEAIASETSAFDKNGAKFEMTQNGDHITDCRYFVAEAGGKVGPQESVYFYSTDLTFTAPTGEKITVKMGRNTVFGDDVMAPNSDLNGKVNVESGVEYLYNTSLTLSANHYVTCSVVDGGVEKSFGIDCLNGGLFRENRSITDIFWRK